LARLNSAAGGLGTPANLSTLSGTSGDDAAVSVSTSAGALAGGYDVVVNELARSQVTVSASRTPDATTDDRRDRRIASRVGGVAVTSPAGGDAAGLATDDFNGTAVSGVTASVIRTSPTTVSTRPGFDTAGARQRLHGQQYLERRDGRDFHGHRFRTTFRADSRGGQCRRGDGTPRFSSTNIPVTTARIVFADVMPGVRR
jgi:hypothetical protein